MTKRKTKADLIKENKELLIKISNLNRDVKSHHELRKNTLVNIHNIQESHEKRHKRQADRIERLRGMLHRSNSRMIKVELRFYKLFDKHFGV